MAFIQLLNHADYEIQNEYPFIIKKKSNQKAIKEGVAGNGYVQVSLNGKSYLKHRLIALQFIPNPDPALYFCIDHKNRDKTDYHLENLRWVTYQENSKNKTSTHGVEYEWLEEEDLPDDLIEVNDYGNHMFENYYYSPSLDKFMFWNGIKYRLLHINYLNNGSAFVYTYDVNESRVSLCYSKFKKLYNLN